MTIKIDPFYRQAKAYRTLDDAFRGVEYAQWLDKDEYSYSPTPLFVAFLTLLSCCAIIAIWLMYS